MSGEAILRGVKGTRKMQRLESAMCVQKLVRHPVKRSAELVSSGKQWQRQLEREPGDQYRDDAIYVRLNI